ncbi:metalloregulator ArsR/SmtB family transcription factor [Lacimicrobium sp. SS2-24]|uniref:metalloregulator ArsR/SmtB family transcription factor n=1 Tax=Lacimicrobium sp. SS2-24 TaxID=2005569 RepID=UPI000B4B6C97|nr:metalloregulator ArsR/SmtB family transcription factor [Lacimicrobium sp. SS2-24]
MSPLQLFKCLAEDTRLKILLLLSEHGELCVCELTCVLELSQPKVSRHLAELRKCALLADERRGKWVYYRLNDTLADWARELLALTAARNPDLLAPLYQNLQRMHDKPQSLCSQPASEESS